MGLIAALALWQQAVPAPPSGDIPAWLVVTVLGPMLGAIGLLHKQHADSQERQIVNLKEMLKTSDDRWKYWEEKAWEFKDVAREGVQTASDLATSRRPRRP